MKMSLRSLVKIPSLLASKHLKLAGVLAVIFLGVAIPGRADTPPDTFVATGSLLDGGRDTHSAVRLTDGRVLVIGGSRADHLGSKASSETYDPASGLWSLSGTMSTPRNNTTANVLPDGRVLVAGGGNGAPIFATTEIWNPATGTFTAGPAMSVPRALHSSVRLADGRILVAGGTSVSDGAFALASAEIYNPSTGTWTPTGSMATSRNVFAAVLLPDGRVLIAGGSKGREGDYASTANCEIYNPSTGIFTPAAPMTKTRNYPGATLLADGRVLVAGGSSIAGYVATSRHDAEIYDPSANTWTPAIGNLTAGGPRMSLTRLSDGRVLAAGGYDYSTSAVERDADIFAPPTSTFSPLTPMAVARYEHSATLLGDGSVLMAGGTFQFSAPPYGTSTAERFVPMQDAGCAALLAQNTALSEQVSTLTAQNTALSNQLAQAQNNLAAANAANQALQTQNASLTTQITTLTTQNTALSNQLAQCQSDLATATAASQVLQTQNAVLLAANAQLQNQVTTLTAQAAALATQLNGLQSQITTLAGSLGSVFNNPAFQIPGGSLSQQLQALSTAIGNLNHGQQQALYFNLGGKKK
jgi:hypothetical protein